jgi:mono/diheme cytochrome c family protein
MSTPNKWVLLLAVTSLLLSLTACQKLQEVQTLFVTRPTEKMPQYKPVEQLQVAGQNWTPYQRQWFYHTSQGTVLLPYKWFLALEQPHIKVIGDVPLFRDSQYLARFGFLPDDASEQNPDGLPVGLAKGTVTDPQTKQTMEVVGLTCAACHTGQLDYKGKGLRIDGGSATVQLAAFQAELGYAVGYAKNVPFRFDRFAKRVLGDNASEEAKQQLRSQLEAVLAKGVAEQNIADAKKLYAAEGGFGRTDALGRIGNLVFGTELNNDNLRVADAPVNFPPVWYTSWFDWVQYNGAIQQPMVRNIGEALGVRAAVNLSNPQAGLYSSTVNVKNLRDLEAQLAGPEPFSGLHAPTWPESLFGAIDQAKAETGKQLYQQRCQGCHLPPVNSASIQDQQSKYWTPGLENKRFLKMTLIPIAEIGTDPKAAVNWQQRTADTGDLGLGTVSAAVGLQTVTDKIAALQYAALGLSAEQQIEWNGFRNSGVQAPLAYKARPLAGIWATPPFLHNGSVPNLYQLLLPAAQRDKTFYTGSREFDPKYVGYSTAPFEGGFEFRTTDAGNSNAGHEFRNAPPGNGVIGPELTDDERWAIIEYLKTL